MGKVACCRTARFAGVPPHRTGVCLLQFAEMVLRCLPNGAEAIEAADGIDAMEAVQFGDAPPELQQMAAALVDKYYGAD